MTSDPADTAALAADSPADSGLRCPECEYNLTGLTLPRCPECGTAFDWDEVRRAAANRPLIAFERARRWRKVPAFFVTWVTVLFTPWVFARQIAARVSTLHALAFALVCFLSTALYYAVHAEAEFVSTWLSTAPAYIVLQTLWLTLIDVPHWDRPVATLRFWALVGCYTSAVMMTEFVYGPPPVYARDLWQLATEGKADWVSELYKLSAPSLVCWTQMGLWLAALGCIYARRLAKRPASAGPILLALAVCFSLLVLYSSAVDLIGERVYKWWSDVL